MRRRWGSIVGTSAAGARACARERGPGRQRHTQPERTCSRERVAGILRSLGAEEIRSIVAERGNVEVRCEFCNRAYQFDAVDATTLFVAAPAAPPGIH